MTSVQPALLCHYRYDPLDRLINQVQPDTPVHQRFYCKSRLATEIQGALQHSIVQHGDLLLAQQQHQGDAFSATLLGTDLQRSVLHALKKNNERHPIAYSPYGHRRAESGLTSLLGFNGERPDPVTGCYLLGNGYRAFNPVLMQFNSPDSQSPFGDGGLNPYAYCLLDPVNRVDTNGHNSLFTKLKASFTRKLSYRGGYLKMKRGVNATAALAAHKKISKYDARIEVETQKKYKSRSNKIKHDFDNAYSAIDPNAPYNAQNEILTNLLNQPIPYQLRYENIYYHALKQVKKNPARLISLITSKNTAAQPNDILTALNKYIKEIESIDNSQTDLYKSKRTSIFESHFSEHVTKHRRGA